MIPPSILWHVEPKVQAINAYGSIPLRHTSLKELASPVAYENAVIEHFEDLASTVCSLVEAPSPSPTAQPFAKPESQLERLPFTIFLSGLHAIEEEARSTGVVVGVTNTEQEELATSSSYSPRLDGDSGSTVYISSDSFSDYSTAHGVSLVSSETNASPIDTSLATSVDAEDSRQLFPDALRRLRRVPSYEDLRASCFKFSVHILLS